MKENLNKRNEITDRRSMIGRSSTALGALLLASSRTRAGAGNNREKSRELFFDVRKYGASGRRQDNATKSFRDAIQACVAEGGGIVNVPPGEYTVGTIELKDYVTLNIEAGATLFLSQSKSDLKPVE